MYCLNPNQYPIEAIAATKIELNKVNKTLITVVSAKLPPNEKNILFITGVKGTLMNE